MITGFVETGQVGNAGGNLTHDRLNLPHYFFVTLFLADPEMDHYKPINKS